MNRRSIRFRLTAWYSLILAATFAASGAGVWWTIRESIHETVDKDLRSRLEAMREFVKKQMSDPDSGPLAEELAEQGAMAPAGAAYRICGSDGRWIYQSPATGDWDPKPPDSSRLLAGGTVRNVAAGGQRLRILTAPMSLGVIQIGGSLEKFHEMLRGFTWTALLASPLLLMLASVGGYWMSRRALAPVDRITQTAGAISAQSLSERLPLRGAGDELDRLSSTLNAMLSRLESAFQRMTRFTADASHELRTPVSIIRTAAELARAKPRSDQEYREALDRILAESERTSRLIDDLMLLARADAGADGIAPNPMDLAECLREACAQAGVLAEAAGVSMETSVAVLCPVYGDEEALRRLFVILLDNAVKYTPRGGKVHVALEVDGASAGGSAVVEVRDTGLGIAAQDLPHIFERFYRTAKDRSRKTGGAGLGLSIAQWIAKRHGGEIIAESSPGRGSSFRLRLPLEGKVPGHSAILQNSGSHSLRR